MEPSAKEILESKVFKRALEATRQQIKDEWAREPSQQAREALWHTLNATESLTRQLRIIADRDTVERMERN